MSSRKRQIHGGTNEHRGSLPIDEPVSYTTQNFAGINDKRLFCTLSGPDTISGDMLNFKHEEIRTPKHSEK
jgi:hypothetical protein